MVVHYISNQIWVGLVGWQCPAKAQTSDPNMNKAYIDGMWFLIVVKNVSLWRIAGIAEIEMSCK